MHFFAIVGLGVLTKKTLKYFEFLIKVNKNGNT